MPTLLLPLKTKISAHQSLKMLQHQQRLATGRFVVFKVATIQLLLAVPTVFVTAATECVSTKAVPSVPKDPRAFALHTVEAAGARFQGVTREPETSFSARHTAEESGASLKGVTSLRWVVPVFVQHMVVDVAVRWRVATNQPSHRPSTV